jgi:uncharacterized protein (TIGR03067 family)
MRTRVWLLGGLFALTCVEARPNDLAKDERQLLQGTWVLQSSEQDGTRADGDEACKLSVSFSGDSYSSMYAGVGFLLTGTYAVDASRKPKEITVTAKLCGADVPFLGIYELSGDTLKMCFNSPCGMGRPTLMSGALGTKQSLWILKRR